jgi:membrane-bound serine protease (ClpP class)
VGVSGTIGVINLMLALFALAVLPINYIGLALSLIGLALFVAEAFVTSYGFLAFGGIGSMTLGGLMPIDSPAGAIDAARPCGRRRARGYSFSSRRRN